MSSTDPPPETGAKTSHFIRYFENGIVFDISFRIQVVRHLDEVDEGVNKRTKTDEENNYKIKFRASTLIDQDPKTRAEFEHEYTDDEGMTALLMFFVDCYLPPAIIENKHFRIRV